MLVTDQSSTAMTLKISSNAKEISLACEALHALCVYVTGNEKCAFDVQYALVEALNNVVEHAYGYQSDHEIIISWLHQDNRLQIEIIDNGRSLTVLPKPVLPDFEAENGRGWWIISACVDEYYYKVVENIERECALRPGEKNDKFDTTLVKSHQNILTLIKQF